MNFKDFVRIDPPTAFSVNEEDFPSNVTDFSNEPAPSYTMTSTTWTTWLLCLLAMIILLIGTYCRIAKMLDTSYSESPGANAGEEEAGTGPDNETNNDTGVAGGHPLPRWTNRTNLNRRSLWRGGNRARRAANWGTLNRLAFGSPGLEGAAAERDLAQENRGIADNVFRIIAGDFSDDEGGAPARGEASLPSYAALMEKERLEHEQPPPNFEDALESGIHAVTIAADNVSEAEPSFPSSSSGPSASSYPPLPPNLPPSGGYPRSYGKPPSYEETLKMDEEKNSSRQPLPMQT